MKRFSILYFFLAITTFASAQIALPIQQSVLPKNNLVVNYDFSKSASYSRGATSVTNIAGTASGNATIFNTPNFMNSLGYVMFNGSNQYVATPNLKTYFKTVNTTVQKALTISLWFYPTAASGVIVGELDSQTPSSGWHATNIELVNKVVNYRFWPSTTAITSSALTLNQWHHVALVYDGTAIKAYLDGTLQGTQTYVRDIPTTSQNFTVGAGETTSIGTSAYGTFNLAQFKLHNLPLNDDDILQEYNLRKTEFDYTLHSPTTNTSPTYWTSSSNWSGDTFYANAPSPTTTNGYHFTPWTNSPQGWSAGANDLNQYLTLTYEEPAYIKGVVIQGRTDGVQYVTQAHVETSLTGSAPWTRQLTTAVVNSNNTDDVYLNFPTNIFAKAVKFIPAQWTNHITMRMGMVLKPNTYVTNGLVLNIDPANLKSYSGTGTTISDLSGNSNNGTLYNSPTFNSSNGGFFTLNGTNQYIGTPAISSTAGNNSRTVITWYKSTANQTTCLLDKGAATVQNAEQLFLAYTNSVGAVNAYPPYNNGAFMFVFGGMTYSCLWLHQPYLTVTGILLPIPITIQIIV